MEHVGRTSVPGLPAKPVIDIDIVIRDRAILPDVIAALEKIGYRHEGDLDIPGREAFKYTDKPHLMTHHLYVCPVTSEELHRHLTFRDHLRSNPQAAQKYSRIKEKAAELYPYDIDKYMEYKAHCIKEIYLRCGLLRVDK